MTLLTDTMVFLQLATDPERLPDYVRAGVDRAERVVLSAASVWEMAIKASIGKLRLPTSAGEYAASRTKRLGLELLPVDPRHAAGVELLPWHHRDPFDRLLIAQAIAEGFTLVTTDDAIKRYNVSILAER